MKKLPALMLALSMILVLCACGGTNAADESAAAPASEKQTVAAPERPQDAVQDTGDEISGTENTETEEADSPEAGPESAEPESFKLTWPDMGQGIRIIKPANWKCEHYVMGWHIGFKLQPDTEEIPDIYILICCADASGYKAQGINPADPEFLSIWFDTIEPSQGYTVGEVNITTIDGHTAAYAAMNDSAGNDYCECIILNGDYPIVITGYTRGPMSSDDVSVIVSVMKSTTFTT